MAERLHFDQRERTGRLVNWHLLEGLDMSPGGYPVMHKVDPDDLPFGVSDWLGFNEVATDRHPEGKAVHFFLDDYQFQRVWTTPEKYLDQLRRYAYVLQPDFSLYTDFPAPMQQWDHYRNQLLGAWWQGQGLLVLPVAEWGGPETFAWCFEGLPEDSAVAVSTIGSVVHPDTRLLLFQGIQELIRQKKPKQLLIYGRPTPEIQQLLRDNNVPWLQYAHGQAKRMKAFRERCESAGIEVDTHGR